MSTASRGAAREHKVKKLLEAEGWAVTRGAGSHGCADLWAARQMMDEGWDFPDLRLIQVKGNTGSPWKSFCPKDRDELSALAAQTGGVAELWHWPASKPCRIYYEDEWPKGAVDGGSNGGTGSRARAGSAG